jgi:hypothetical protein
MKTKNVKLENLKAKSMTTLKHYKLNSTTPPSKTYVHQTEVRILQLRKDHELANGNPCRWVKSTRVTNRDTMQLFKRFVELYESSIKQPQSIGTIELCPISDPAC